MLGITKAKGLAAVVITAVVLAVTASPAAAHTGFDASTPGDGEVAAGPVSEITLTFTGDATPAGEGFVVLDPTGTIRTPDEISSTDNLTWTLRFDEPLAGGDVGVRWMVAAPDTHPIEGSFSFTVTAPAPLPTEVPDPSTGADEAASATETTEPDDDSLVEEPEPTTESTVPITVPSDDDSASAASVEPVDLDTFLDTGRAEPAAADPIAAGARILSLLGAVLAIGGAAFAAFGLRGDPNDVGAVLRWVRRGGLLLIVGAAIQAVTTTVTLAGDWAALGSTADLGNALWSSTGLAIALRALGGCLIVANRWVETTTASAVGDPVVVARQLATIGAGHNPAPPDRDPDEPFVYADDQAWDRRLARGALFGVALVAVSFMFDGHTVSEGPRWLHAVANLIHVTTAATWAGGVAMLTLTIHRRRRAGRPAKALQLGMRFSVIATIGLVGAGLAGLALSAVVLDSVSEIWTTPWGRLLTLKVALVAAAAVGGAYNHRIVVPALDRNPDHQPTIDRFRSVVTFEAAALITVAIVTAFLIAASSA